MPVKQATVADYVGRTADMAAFRGIFPHGKEQLLAQQLVGVRDGGMLVTGIQKLVQNVAILLCTRKGSKNFRPDDGCQFLIDCARGRWRTGADVAQSFYLSRSDIRQQLLAVQQPTDPPDECYQSMDLLGVTLAGDTVAVRVNVVSLAGTSYTFITPITVPLR